MSDSPDLSTVTLDEMMAELGRRYDGVVLLVELERTADLYERDMIHRGGDTRAWGLAERFLEHLRAEWRKAEET